MPVELLYSVIGFMAMVIIGLIGSLWTGQRRSTNRMFELLDDLRKVISSLESGLRGDLVTLDRRVTRIEERYPRHDERT